MKIEGPRYLVNIELKRYLQNPPEVTPLKEIKKEVNIQASKDYRESYILPFEVNIVV